MQAAEQSKTNADARPMAQNTDMSTQTHTKQLSCRRPQLRRANKPGEWGTTCVKAHQQHQSNARHADQHDQAQGIILCRSCKFAETSQLVRKRAYGKQMQIKKVKVAHSNATMCAIFCQIRQLLCKHV